MNALNRDIKEGEKVVLRKEMFKPQYQAIEERTVTVTGGFGRLESTSGSALFVRFSDGETARYKADTDISVKETYELWAAQS